MIPSPVTITPCDDILRLAGPARSRIQTEPCMMTGGAQPITSRRTPQSVRKSQGPVPACQDEPRLCDFSWPRASTGRRIPLPQLQDLACIRFLQPGKNRRRTNSSTKRNAPFRLKNDASSPYQPGSRSLCTCAPISPASERRRRDGKRLCRQANSYAADIL